MTPVTIVILVLAALALVFLAAAYSTYARR